MKNIDENKIEEMLTKANKSVMPPQDVFQSIMNQYNANVTKANLNRNTNDAGASNIASPYQSFFTSMKKYLLLGVPVVAVLLVVGIVSKKSPEHIAVNSDATSGQQMLQEEKPVSVESSIDDIVDGFMIDANNEAVMANQESSDQDVFTTDYQLAADIGNNNYETV